MNQLNDIDIIERIVQLNESEHFSILIEKYKAMIFKLCLGFAINEQEAEDLFQDTFTNAFLDLKNFKNKSSFSTWLYRIGLNICLNHKRKIKNWQNPNEIENMLESTEYNPERLTISKDLYIKINEAILSLPNKQKTAFVLSKFNNLPQKDIAEIMLITEGAVEALLQRAKANLRKILDKRDF